ncbi:MAG: hypothetical protein AAFQ53_16245 [Bacteroidota bacterium]
MDDPSEDTQVRGDSASERDGERSDSESDADSLRHALSVLADLRDSAAQHSKAAAAEFSGEHYESLRLRVEPEEIPASDDNVLSVICIEEPDCFVVPVQRHMAPEFFDVVDRIRALEVRPDVAFHLETERLDQERRNREYLEKKFRRD